MRESDLGELHGPSVESVIRRARALFERSDDRFALRSPSFSRNPVKRWVVNRRTKVIVSNLPSCGPTSLALDFGPGYGALLPWLSLGHGRVLGFDIDSASHAAAKRLVDGFALNNVELVLVHESRELDAIPTQSVDTVLAADVLEHISDVDRILDEFSRILKPSGSLVVSLPTEGWLYRLGERKDVGHVYDGVPGMEIIVKKIERRFTISKQQTVLTLFRIIQAHVRAR